MSEHLVKETVEVDTLQDITCNICKTSCREKMTGQFECAVLTADWGYGTLWDGEKHRAHICQVCYHRLLHPPNVLMALEPDVTEF